MSKFIDRLKQLSEGAPQPLGFRTQAAQARLKVQLVASLSSEEIPDGVPDADAAFLCVDMPLSKDTSKKLTEKVRMPFGVCAASKADVKALQEAGVDFVVFPPTAALRPLADSKLGQIIEVDSALTDTQLRALNAVPVDAVLMMPGLHAGETPTLQTASAGETPAPPMPATATPGSGDGGFTWQDLMAIQRITGMVNKPVLFPVPSTINETDLKTIWHAGVDGVVVAITSENAADIAALKKKIAGLEYPTAKRERAVPSVPRPTLEPEQQEDEEEEDD